MSEGKNPVALVTGASNGIGLELAKLLAAAKHDLVLVARSEEKLRVLADELEQAHGIVATVIAQDLADPGAPAHIVEEVTSLGIDVEILVNNAGLGLYGPFTETSLEREVAMIQVNVIALTELTKRFLPGMVAAGRGRILNVASTAAFQPGPLMAVYYATKAFVLSFSEALGNEVDGTGVTVTALCPGPTESGFQATAALQESKLVSGRKLPDAASVARAGFEGLMRGRRVVIPGAQNWVLAQSVRFLPRQTVTSFVRRAQERKAS